MNGLAISQNSFTDLSETPWRIPPSNLSLEKNEVHIWLAQLDQEKVTEFVEILSNSERARANRFRFEIDRKRFVVGRGILRNILSKYLKTNPRTLCFEYNLHGKPSLSEQLHSHLKFNLSHSENLALYAISYRREIGIDLEQVKPSFVDEGMISLCLTHRERAHFYLLSEQERISFFFNCWTTKEAFLKANGQGLYVSPNEIETSELSQNTQLTFQKLPAIDGYSTALAVEGNTLQLKYLLMASNIK